MQHVEDYQNQDKNSSEFNKELQGANKRKWTSIVLKAGYTVIPTVIIRHQRELGLDAIDLAILSHLISYWWDRDNPAHPSKSTLANALNLSPKTIQRRIARMEKNGLVDRIPRQDYTYGIKSNEYHFDGLIGKLTPLALDSISKRKKRS